MSRTARSLVCLVAFAASLAACSYTSRAVVPPADEEIESSTLYAADGSLITTFHAEENRKVVPLEQIPEHVRDAVIAIEACGDALCGRIVGIPLDGPQDPIPTDHQGRSQCGLGIIQGAVPGEDGTWSARIVDPRDGSVYRARMRLDAEHRLHLRGYIGIPLLGRTQVWTPFERPIPESCRLPAVL